jgi:hypothetical protein
MGLRLSYKSHFLGIGTNPASSTAWTSLSLIIRYTSSLRRCVDLSHQEALIKPLSADGPELLGTAVKVSHEILCFIFVFLLVGLNYFVPGKIVGVS